ncbi:MAG: hypothetical protein ACI9NG_002626 [Hyphomonas sp.]|jgi:hypothetical protein
MRGPSPRSSISARTAQTSASTRSGEPAKPSAPNRHIWSSSVARRPTCATLQQRHRQGACPLTEARMHQPHRQAAARAHQRLAHHLAALVGLGNNHRCTHRLGQRHRPACPVMRAQARRRRIAQHEAAPAKTGCLRHDPARICPWPAGRWRIHGHHNICHCRRGKHARLIDLAPYNECHFRVGDQLAHQFLPRQ